MKRLLRFTPAVLAGLLAGSLVSTWISPRPSPPVEKKTASSQPGGSAAFHERQPGDYAAFGDMVNRRMPQPEMPATSEDAALRASDLTRAGGSSPVRAALDSEVLRGLLPGEKIDSNIIMSIPPAGSPGDVEFIGRMAKVKPAEALASVNDLASSRRKEAGEVEALRRRVFREWLRTDPQAALAEAARENRSNYHRSLNLQALMQEWSRQDPGAAAAALASLPEGGPGFQRKDFAQTLFRGWHERDPAAALAWAQTQAEPEWRETLTSLSEELTAADPAAKTAALLAAPQRDTNRLAETFSEWLSTDPPAALAKLAAIPPEDNFWTRDASQVSQWWALAVRVRSGLTPEQFLETVNSNFPAGPQRDAVLQGLTDYGAGNDIPFAVRMVAEMGESRARGEAMSHLAEQWMRTDPVALSEWLDAQPGGESKNAAVSRFAALLAKSDPEAAARWTDTVPDEYWQKEEIMRTVGEAWNATDPDAAEAWRTK